MKELFNFEKGKLYILAGHPATGKSSLAIQIASEFAEEGKQVTIITLELLKTHIEQRLNKSKKDLSNINIEDDYWINHNSELIRDIMKKYPKTEILIIDYLQLLDDGGRNTISGARLKSIAEEFQIPILCLSHISRTFDNHNSIAKDILLQPILPFADSTAVLQRTKTAINEETTLTLIQSLPITWDQETMTFSTM